MSTIRPLATIAVLAALGVYLAYQINQGPTVALNDEWANAGIEVESEPPAWDAGGAEPSATEAPAFGESDSSLTARSAPSWAEVDTAAPDATIEQGPAQAFPALPALPAEDPAAADPMPIQNVPAGAELAEEPLVTPTFPTASNQQLSLPASIPQANYGDATPAAADKSVTTPTISGRVPSTSPSAGPSMGASAGGGLGAAQSTSLPSSSPGFQAAWQAIEAALERGELARAHRMLSQWRDEPSLSTQDHERVESLLGQLAGTVVYSTEHVLEPAHKVAPGETLVTIAQQYQVPWQLLAKINGVSSVNGVQPGQLLKVVRGPFDAQVDLAQGEVVLLLDDRYAGKFPIRVEGQAPGDGEWRVGQKLLDSPADPKVVLESPAGERVELSAGTTPAAGARGRLTVASNDLAELYDILSVGSSVTVRR